MRKAVGVWPVRVRNVVPNRVALPNPASAAIRSIEKSVSTSSRLARSMRVRRMNSRGVQSRYDRNFRRWMPHITLIYPFRPANEFDALSEQFARILADLQPFDLELTTFNLFQHPRRGCTIWLAPEPEDSVIKLQTRLWQVVPDCDEVRRHPNGFTPHLSIAQARRKNIAADLITEWRNTWTTLKFRVSQIHLIWRNDPPDDVFRVGRSVQLGKM